MTREFRHSVTGRSIVVREGSRTERLVAEDKKNWSEVKPETSSKSETPGGSRDAGNSKRRRSASRKAADDDGGDEG